MCASSWRQIRKTGISHTNNSLEFYPCIRRLVLEPRQFNSIPIRNQRNCGERSPQGQTKGPRRCWCRQAVQKYGAERRWNASVICETYKTGWQTESRRMKEDLALPFDDPIFPLRAHFFLIQSPRKTNVVFITLVQRCSQEHSSDTR